jgi:hypothetical protein
MQCLKKDGVVCLAIGFTLWYMSSYVTFKAQAFLLLEYFIADLMFKTGTALVIIGVLIIITYAVEH